MSFRSRLNCWHRTKLPILLCHIIPCSLPHTPERTKSQFKKKIKICITSFSTTSWDRQEVHVKCTFFNAESLLSLLTGDRHKSFIKNGDSQFPSLWGFMETGSWIFKIDYLHIAKASQHVSFECDASQKKYRFLHFLFIFLDATNGYWFFTCNSLDFHIALF